MQRKTAFLVCAMAALVNFNQAYADAHAHSEAGKFEIKSADGNYSLGLKALLQTRLEFGHERKTKKSDARNDLGFSLPKATVGFYGNAFDPSLTYLFQAQFQNDLDGKTLAEEVKAIGENKPIPKPHTGSVHLVDYSANWAFNREYFQVAVGKFIVPYARQQVMSPAKSQFYAPNTEHDVSFGITKNGRDVGAMFHNGYSNPIEYALAVVSGGVVGRLGYNYNGIDGYEAVDFTGGDLRFGVGASGYLKTDYMSKDLNDLRASFDFIAKAHGFATNGALYYAHKKKDADSKGLNDLGATIDLGYLIQDRFEPVARLDWSKHDKNKPWYGATIGLNHYCFGHNLKAQIYASAQIRDTKWNKIVGGIQLQFAL